MPTDTSENCIGRLDFWRAKKGGVNTLASTKAGTPQANWRSTSAVRSGVGAGEGAARDGRIDDEERHDQQRDGRRQRERHGQADAVIHRPRGARVIVLGKMPRQARHQGETHRDADEAERQLVEPVGIVEHAARAFVRARQRLRHQRC